MSSKEDWTPKNIDRDSLYVLYESILERVRAVAKDHGYAIGVHGSMRRDLDLIAAPWVDTASEPKVLAEAIAKELKWWVHDDVADKPLGRTAFTIYTHNHAHIDLSVCPSVIP